MDNVKDDIARNRVISEKMCNGEELMEEESMLHKIDKSKGIAILRSHWVKVENITTTNKNRGLFEAVDGFAPWMTMIKGR